jgi:DNA invertase Pin-like site-specific DNA recombinase
LPCNTPSKWSVVAVVRASCAPGTTAGKAMFQMLGVFAEFDRGIIGERRQYWTPKRGT